jgi:Trypsin-like serine proteases, typically periplasmic, contain C-terminal PDZ domain
MIKSDILIWKNTKGKVVIMKKLILMLSLVLIISLLPAQSLAATSSTYEDYAQSLSKLGVFVGTGSGFELDRTPTRIEGLVMLIRLLGAENNALSLQKNPIPFTDVPKWAAGYVAYAYENGLTNGISSTKFGSTNQLDAKSYVTFLLRSLGYNDQGGDFSYNNALLFSKNIGLINDYTYSTLSNNTFLRAHIAKTSYDALKFPYRGGDTLLIDKLMASNKIDRSIGEAFKSLSLSQPVEMRNAAVINVDQNLESVVMLTVTTNSGELGPGIGSGVILSSDGVIVTNFHVVEDARDIDVTFNNKSVYNGDVYVQGYNKDLDLAIIKINMTGLTPAVIGDSSTVKSGDSVIAIGSPYGYLNTVTDGIVSAIRDDSIQISAPINPGNSGGGLFDKNGKLIGIPNSGILLANNMGFSIPINQLSSVTRDKNVSIENFSAITNELLPSPKGLNLLYEFNSAALLDWNSVKGAEAYNIYVKQKGDDDYYYLDTAYPVGSPRYLVTDLMSREQYSFKISAMVNGIETQLSDPLTFTTHDYDVEYSGFHPIYDEYPGPKDFPGVYDFGKIFDIQQTNYVNNTYYYRLPRDNYTAVLISKYQYVLQSSSAYLTDSYMSENGTYVSVFESKVLDKKITVSGRDTSPMYSFSIKVEELL